MIKYKIFEVLRVKRLGRKFYEMYIKYDSKPEPGTFAMVWLPGYEAIPLSFAGWFNDVARFFVKVVGPTTAALFTATKVGISQPLGRRAPTPLGRPTYVAGGAGIAPFLYMKDEWGGKLLYGAKSRSEIPKIDTIDEIATEDGSVGFKGTVIDLFFTNPSKRDVYACGPPPMINEFLKRAQTLGIKGYFSTERPIKCGIGICGSCAFRGKLLCKEPWLPIMD